MFFFKVCKIIHAGNLEWTIVAGHHYGVKIIIKLLQNYENICMSGQNFNNDNAIHVKNLWLRGPYL